MEYAYAAAFNQAVLEVADEEAAAIRMAVATADLAGLGLGRSIAAPKDAADLAAFLSQSTAARPARRAPLAAVVRPPPDRAGAPGMAVGPPLPEWNSGPSFRCLQGSDRL